MKRRTLLRNLFSSMLAVPALGAYEKTSNLCVVMAKFRGTDGEGDSGVMSRKPWAG